MTSPDAPGASSAPASGSPPAEPRGAEGQRLGQIGRAVGGFVAPATLLSGLLYFFGWLHAYYTFDYFGVSSTVLGFSTTDYLRRSVDALYLPLAVAALLGLGAAWGHGEALPRLRGAPEALRRRMLLSIAALGCSLTLAGGILTLIFGADSGVAPALAPLGFATGVLIVAYAARLRPGLGLGRQAPASGWREAAEWALVLLLIAVGAFSAASDYAGGVGASRARQYEEALPYQAGVVLYSKDGLDLPAQGIAEVRCRAPGAAYHFRYDNLVLLLQSGGKYLLVPRTWTHDNGDAAVLLTDSDAIRLEFYPAGTQPAGHAC